MSPETWWFIARATGLVAYALLGVSVVGGLFITTRLLGRRPPPDWMLDWHRFVGALSLVFTALHLAGIWIDDYIEFGFDELLLPFVSDWQPVGVGLGVIALYLVLAVETTSLLRRHMPVGLWRAVHRASVPAFALATVHLIMSGADADNPFVLAAIGGFTGLTALLLAFWATRQA